MMMLTKHSSSDKTAFLQNSYLCLHLIKTEPYCSLWENEELHKLGFQE